MQWPWGASNLDFHVQPGGFIKSSARMNKRTMEVNRRVLAVSQCMNVFFVLTSKFRWTCVIVLCEPIQRPPPVRLIGNCERSPLALLTIGRGRGRTFQIFSTSTIEFSWHISGECPSFQHRYRNHAICVACGWHIAFTSKTC